MGNYRNTWGQVEAALKYSDRVFIGGTPAAGKTYIAMNTGLRKDQEVFSITVTPDMGVLSVLGGMMPNEKGTFSFVGGPVYRAMKTGGRLVINEIALASSDVYALLLGACDTQESAFITLPDNSVLKPEPGYQVVATSNSRLEEMEEPLQTRFAVGLWVNEPNPAAFETFADGGLRDTVKNTVGNSISEVGDRTISLRHWVEARRIIERGGKNDETMDIMRSIFGPTLAAHVWRYL